jgi:hypothetical protein
MAVYSYDSEGHSCKVTICVADEHFCWKEVVIEKAERGPDKWDYER